MKTIVLLNCRKDPIDNFKRDRFGGIFDLSRGESWVKIADVYNSKKELYFDIEIKLQDHQSFFNVDDASQIKMTKIK